MIKLNIFDLLVNRDNGGFRLESEEKSLNDIFSRLEFLGIFMLHFVENLDCFII